MNKIDEAFSDGREESLQQLSLAVEEFQESHTYLKVEHEDDHSVNLNINEESVNNQNQYVLMEEPLRLDLHEPILQPIPSISFKDVTLPNSSLPLESTSSPNCSNFKNEEPRTDELDDNHSSFIGFSRKELQNDNDKFLGASLDFLVMIRDLSRLKSKDQATNLTTENLFETCIKTMNESKSAESFLVHYRDQYSDRSHPIIGGNLS